MTRYAPVLLALLLAACEGPYYDTMSPEEHAQARFNMEQGLRLMQMSRQPTYVAPAYVAPAFGNTVDCTRIGSFVSCNRF